MEVKNQENNPNAFSTLLLVEFQPQRQLRCSLTIKKPNNYDNKDF